MYHEAEQFEIPPPRPIKLKNSPCPICGRERTAPYHCDDCRVAVLHCNKCGLGKIIASGYNATGMTTLKRFEIMRHLGWSYETGRFLCRECSCPMDHTEKSEYKNFLEYFNNDGSDVSNLSAFRQAMMAKYGTEQMERYFNS